jgi:hypothetical protein
MPTEPETLTLAQAVHRAVEVCDRDGADELLADLLARFEDRDEPITAVGDVEQLMAETVGVLDPEGDDPALATAAAIVTYLAHRRDMVDADDERLLALVRV